MTSNQRDDYPEVDYVGVKRLLANHYILNYNIIKDADMIRRPLMLTNQGDRNEFKQVFPLFNLDWRAQR